MVKRVAFLITVIAFTIGAIQFQIYLSKLETDWYGLAIPLSCLIPTLIYSVSRDKYISYLSSFFFISTIVNLFIYVVCHFSLYEESWVRQTIIIILWSIPNLLILVPRIRNAIEYHQVPLWERMKDVLSWVKYLTVVNIIIFIIYYFYTLIW